MIFEGTLLYEPIRARATGEGIDEWMYELHNMDAGAWVRFARRLTGSWKRYSRWPVRARALPPSARISVP